MDAPILKLKFVEDDVGRTESTAVSSGGLPLLDAGWLAHFTAVSENILLPQLPVLSCANMLAGFEALFAYHQ